MVNVACRESLQQRTVDPERTTDVGIRMVQNP